jgi:hypothetical protein
MIATESPTISCEECGKTYRWKEELAGRKVRCKCGEVMFIDARSRGLIAEGFAVVQANRSCDQEPTTTTASSGIIGRLTSWWR